MPKLTETYVRKAPHPKTGTSKHWDNEVRGFALFVGKQAKTWYFQRDVGGETRRMKIGRYPTIPAAAARETAQSLALELSRGAGKAFARRMPTLDEAMKGYLERPKLRSDAHKEGVRAQMQAYLKDWLKLPLDEITRGMVVSRHQSLADRPSAANHLMRNFRAIWNYARRTGDSLPEPPTLAVEWYPEEPGSEVIEDLAAWRARVDALSNPIHATFYRLLLFTGFRKSEALKLRWKDVLGDRIRLPMTKNGRAFDLPILDVHRAILEPMRGLHGEWVFPSPKAADGHLANPFRLEWSFHAHRRTFATVAVEAGVLEEVVGRLLNHTPVSITGQRYARPSLDALRVPMEIVCAALSARSGFVPATSELV